MARIQPGLERITALLKDATFPWKSIHVAGTNGKGSVCHYASSMLVGRSIKVGKFTSPHLVDRWDCITIDGKPVEESKFLTVQNHLLRVNKKLQIGASPFEILTAAAFTCFHDANVKIGVVEVGMGGTLDSTNILNNQHVSVITKIARDHQDFLGTTLSEIATHKAGILRPGVPYIINAANEANVQSVIDDYAQSIGAGPRLLSSSWELDKRLYQSLKWVRVTNGLEPFQLENLKLAVVAVMQALENLDQSIKPTELAKTLLLNAKQHHSGRQEFVHATPVFKGASHRKNHILVDGAHNPDAGEALNDFVSRKLRFGQTPAPERPVSGWPVTWVVAMTKGKDAHEYLARILKPGDKIVTTVFGPVDGMPWVKPMDPKELLEVARSVQPDITGVHVPVIGALRALCTAKYLSDQIAPWAPIVLTGSLYLVGDLHRELRPRASRKWWTDPSEAAEADREAFLKTQAEERERVNAVLKPSETSEEHRKLQEELEALDREVQGLEIQGQHLLKDQSTTLGMTDGEQALSALERLEFEDRRFAELHSTPEQLAASLIRAEKAKVALAREQVKIEAAAKAQEDKRGKRLAHRKHLADRRDRRVERKRVEREQVRQWRDQNFGPRQVMSLPEHKKPEWQRKKEEWQREKQEKTQQREIASSQQRDSLSGDSDPSSRDSFSPRNGSRQLSDTITRRLTLKDDASRDSISPRNGSRQLSDTITRRLTLKDDAPRDALSALSNRDSKNFFFGKSDSASNSRPAQTDPAPPARKSEDDMSAGEPRQVDRQPTVRKANRRSQESSQSEERAAAEKDLSSIIPPLRPQPRDEPRAATSSQRRGQGSRQRTKGSP